MPLPMIIRGAVMFAHFSVYVTGGVCLCMALGMPKADSMGERFSEAMFSFPVTMMLLMISYTAFRGHFMSRVNEHMREYYEGDLWLQAVGELECGSDGEEDEDPLGNDDTSHCLLATDGFIACVAILLLLCTSTSDNLSCLVFAAVMLMGSFHMWHRLSYQHSYISTQLLLFCLGTILLGSILAGVPHLVPSPGGNKGGHELFLSLGSAVFTTAWLYALSSTLCLSDDDKLPKYKRSLMSVWVSGLVCVCICIVVIVAVPLHLSEERLTAVMTNGLLLGIALMIMPLSLAAFSPFGIIRATLTPLVITSTAWRGVLNGKLTPHETMVVIVGMLVSFTLYILIQSLGIKLKFSLLTLCLPNVEFRFINPCSCLDHLMFDRRKVLQRRNGESGQELIKHNDHDRPGLKDASCQTEAVNLV